MCRNRRHRSSRSRRPPSNQAVFRLQAERELLLTNRLILQPLAKVNFFGKDDPQRGLDAGLSSVQAGLRLCYELQRQFAFYIGVAHECAFGDKASSHRNANETIDDTRFVAECGFGSGENVMAK